MTHDGPRSRLVATLCRAHALSPRAALRRRRTTTAAAPAPAASSAPDLPMLEEVGEGEGEVNILAWPGYAEDGSTDPAVRLGDAVRGEDRLQGQRQGLRDVRRGGQPDEDR